jgi:hypothetical protein
MKAATPDIVCLRPEIVEKHCGERRCTKRGLIMRMATSFASTSKKTLGSARSRGGKPKFKVSKNFLIIE